MIDLNFNNTKPPKQGCLLVSEPFLEVDFFQKSVVFLCAHNKNGSFGFVLTNFIDLSLDQLEPELVIKDSKISIGGPVDKTNLYYLHNFGESVPESLFVSETLSIGGNFDILIEQLKRSKNPENHVRFFLGYSGWSENQLMEEINRKSWIVVDPTDDSLILDTNKEDLYLSCLQTLGGKFKMFNQIPDNPNNN